MKDSHQGSLRSPRRYESCPEPTDLHPSFLKSLTQIPKFEIVLVLVLGALGFRDRKETDVLQLICSVSLIAKRSGFSRTSTTTSTRTTPQI